MRRCAVRSPRALQRGVSTVIVVAVSRHSGVAERHEGEAAPASGVGIARPAEHFGPADLDSCSRRWLGGMD